MEVIPAGPPFIIAGLTVSQANEHPFVRQGKREARLTLTDPEDAEKPFDLRVDVDRGVASYVHPLPEASADDFVGDDFAGWGEAQNPKSSPAYFEVAAIPSATVSVKAGRGNRRRGQMGGCRAEEGGRDAAHARGASGPGAELGKRQRPR